jgi:hypothetical protein
MDKKLIFSEPDFIEFSLVFQIYVLVFGLPMKRKNN